MARITLRQLLDHAAEHDYGVPAFNIGRVMTTAEMAKRYVKGELDPKVA